MDSSYSLLTQVLKQKKMHPQHAFTPDEVARIKEQISSVVLKIDVVPMLSQYGINSEQGFFKELEYRLVHYFFSETFESHDLRAQLSRIDPDNELPGILHQVAPDELVQFFSRIIDTRPEQLSPIRKQVRTVLDILGARLAHHGTNWRVWERLQEYPDYQDVFLNAQKRLQRFLNTPSKESYEDLRQVLIRAHDACIFLRHQSIEKGISLALTTRISVIGDVIVRIEQLTALLYFPYSSQDFQFNAYNLAQKILAAKSDKLKLSALLRNYFELVSLEITEFASYSGEKYVDGSKRGFFKMLQKGLIGGVLVGAFAVFKPLFGEMDLAPMMVFFKSTVIYALIFLAIYFFKGTLATKQPAMTASHLAKSLDNINESKEPAQAFANLIQSTFRNQLMALLGNVIMALPLAAVTYYLMMKAGFDLLDDQTATYLLESVHPFTTGSLFYAALTGVCLAISGFLAGAANNWLVFHNIPDRLLRKYTLTNKRSSLKRVSEFLDTHFTDIVSNISLAFLLAFLPFLGFIFRLPLDIRHITFASANVGSSIAHDGFNISFAALSIYLIGVLLIGLINLAVSFSVTFLVAIKSRKIVIHSSKSIMTSAVPHLLKHPWRFFVPF